MRRADLITLRFDGDLSLDGGAGLVRFHRIDVIAHEIAFGIGEFFDIEIMFAHQIIKGEMAVHPLVRTIGKRFAAIARQQIGRYRRTALARALVEIDLPIP